MQWSAADRANYARSNATASIDFDPGKPARVIARQLADTSMEAGHRQILATTLCDFLSDAAGIDICHVRVSDARQHHRSARGRVVFRQYGYYQPTTRFISITNRTAIRGQLLSGGAFLDTLLHEWMHHYDALKLELRSIHSSGFYARLRSLKEWLGVAAQGSAS
ncbi:hypothetical protein HY632_01620 [Candidatus Uhrbacteria bacterium]|nr:hypothetical protein [Candidatus Uhrbacteria bacterium]